MDSNKTGAPPHIYQALRWLIELRATNPAVTGPIDLHQQIDRLQLATQTKLRELEQGLALVERGLALTPLIGAAAVESELQASLLRERRENLKKIEELETVIQKLTMTAPPKVRRNRSQKKKKRLAKKNGIGKKSPKKKLMRPKPKKRRVSKTPTPKKKKAVVKKRRPDRRAKNPGRARPQAPEKQIKKRRS